MDWKIRRLVKRLASIAGAALGALLLTATATLANTGAARVAPSNAVQDATICR